MPHHGLEGIDDRLSRPVLTGDGSEVREHFGRNLVSHDWEALARLTAAVTRPFATGGEAQVAVEGVSVTRLRSSAL